MRIELKMKNQKWNRSFSWECHAGVATARRHDLSSIWTFTGSVWSAAVLRTSRACGDEPSPPQFESNTWIAAILFS
jgi:hypothetical protein